MAARKSNSLLQDIPWNAEYIPQTPSAKQRAFLMLPDKDAFFGGAAAGGKSSVILMGALQYVHVPGYAALLLRRSLVELQQPGALLSRAKAWLHGTSAKYNAETHTFTFPTMWPNGKLGAPSEIQFGYLGDHDVETRYQGAEYQYIGIDELTHFEDENVATYLFSRLRKNACPIHKTNNKGEPNYADTCMYCQVQKSIMLRFRCAGNPGGKGHAWVKNRYRITSEKYIDANGLERLRFIGKHPKKPFISSQIHDNPFVDQAAYIDSLMEVDSIRRDQLLNGNWDISPDSRFKKYWAKYYSFSGDYFVLDYKRYHIHKDFLKFFFTIDVAGTAREGLIDKVVTKKSKSYTVISVWGLTKDYQLVMIYMRRLRQEVPNVVDNIVEVWKMFRMLRPEYATMETNGVGLGIFQLCQAQGVQVKPLQKSRDKIQNSTNATYRMKMGRIWFPSEAAWLQECEDEVFIWTGHPDETDDIIDTISDAANEVTWLSMGLDLQQDRHGYVSSSMTKSPIHIPMSLN